MKFYRTLSAALLVLGATGIANAWAEAYTRCNADLEKQLIQQYKLIPQNRFTADTPSKTSCLDLDAAKTQQILAVSNPISEDDQVQTFDLKLYYIDTLQQQLLHHYEYQDSINSDANVFEEIKLDINPYSTAKDAHVIGLAVQSGHLGGISHTQRELKLFKVSQKHPFQLILDNFLTDFQAAEHPLPSCPEAASSSLKRSLILLNSKSQGIQDIRIHEKLTRRFLVDEQSCRLKSINKQQNLIMKFNKQQYRFKQLKLYEDYGI